MIIAVVSLSDLHALAGMLLVAAVIMITFICPFILLILQRSKVRAFSRPLLLYLPASRSSVLRFLCVAPIMCIVQAVMHGPWDEARPSDSKGLHTLFMYKP